MNLVNQVENFLGQYKHGVNIILVSVIIISIYFLLQKSNSAKTLWTAYLLV